VRDDPAQPDRRLALLSVGHGCADVSQGAVAALIPFLIADRGMSFTSCAALLLVLNIFSSLVQPVFGVIADRRSAQAMMPAGLLAAGTGIAVCGVVSSLPVMLVAVAFAGIGVAAFHPEAARQAGRTGGDRAATAMSWFSVGGNAGFAAAPVLVTPAALLVGPPGAAIVLVPCVAVATLLWRSQRRARIATAAAPPATAAPPDRGHTAGRSAPAGADRWGAFAAVASIAALRTGVSFGLQAYLASYFIQDLHASKATGNAALAAMLITGAAGTLVGGRLADRYDRRMVLSAFMLAIGPLLALLLLAHSVPVALVLTVGLGFATIGNFAITLVIGQEYLPSRPGLASGITLGLAMGIGGLIAAGLGPVADHAGIATVLWILAVLPLGAFALAVTLPGRGEDHARLLRRPASETRSGSRRALRSR
jgi:FSR family fosmidomycin resistance protein-like MFS transporter